MERFLWFCGVILVALALVTCSGDVHAQKAGTTQFAGDLPAQSSPPEDGLFVGPVAADPVDDSVTITIPKAGTAREWIQTVLIGVLAWFIRRKTGIVIKPPPK